MKPWLLTLALAEQAVGLSDPNPRVGCVIVSADGQAILGQGFMNPQNHVDVKT